MEKNNADEGTATQQQKKIKCGLLLFDNYELLAVMGPAEIFGRFPERIEIIMIGAKKEIKCTQGPRVVTDAQLGDDDASSFPKLDWLLVPGGKGTRTEIHNKSLLRWIASQAESEIGRAHV